MFGAISLHAEWLFAFADVFNGHTFHLFLLQLVAHFSGRKVFLIVDDGPPIGTRLCAPPSPASRLTPPLLPATSAASATRPHEVADAQPEGAPQRPRRPRRGEEREAMGMQASTR